LVVHKTTTDYLNKLQPALMELCATANATNFCVPESSTNFKQFIAEHPVVLVQF